MKKTKSNKAWFLVLPVFILVAFSAIVPLMTVVNYSIQDIFGATRYFVGVEWYREILNNSRLQDSLVRQFVFSGSVLLIEVPLGIAVALMMPKAGKWSVVTLLVLALPLLVPLNVVGTIWQIFGRADIGLFGWGLNALGMDYNYAANPMDAWFTVLLMDVWHWTSLIALLCYSGLRAIPDAYYQAASIDRASNWAVFRYIQLPKLKSVLLIGVLLRFMDSFMIYTEPFVLTGGGPGNSTTFLSQALTKMAVGQFDIGPAGAFSIIYFLIILLVSWLFYTAMTHGDSK
ncbi:ABC transporter permease [Psychromonas sp. MB-3u-54]|uniref:carbohydrate ABC transporter permease n=1 Tax=Psychromonas sp. MB-3u-54 TaxID=2058319 RepID=UPI000C3263DC|nr:sugar ABC transporter permease [Psychromonas sp. MB-3u-54]PKH01959.1 ABC transporter permease [Psychromonas sp. MB-3u-54]